jgi:hypothetical protein
MIALVDNWSLKMYDYDWQGIGVLLTDCESGRTIFVQGEDGSNLYDELEACDEIGFELIMSEYFACIEEHEND